MATQKTADYETLIDRLADEEPNIGYRNAWDFSLTTDDLAVVVHQEPDLLQDALIPVTDFIKEAVATAFAEKDDSETDRRLGSMLRTCLVAEAKRLVLLDVQEECGRRDEKLRELRSRARRGDVGALAEAGAL